ncbi:hypothetical protein CBR_g49057 [Chara braunii]|uniref:Uncharacterized protein n=1 Tax=Chara braunii TaxID=69332 RepID=A0A388M436_CHABU|nr:hypothetical protein CBR_g49057 [Chara braunii]|eukprot:GBG89347.1 hypothetical protein CBR_g49057 [Chara braunii]
MVRTKVRCKMTILLLPVTAIMLLMVQPSLASDRRVAAERGTAARRLQISTSPAPSAAIDSKPPPWRSSGEEGRQTAGTLTLVNDSSTGSLFKTNEVVVSYSSPSPADYHPLDLAGCESRVRNMVFVPNVTVFYFSLQIVCADSYRDTVIARADLLPLKRRKKTLVDAETIAVFPPNGSAPGPIPMNSSPAETPPPSSSYTSAPGTGLGSHALSSSYYPPAYASLAPASATRSAAAEADASAAAEARFSEAAAAYSSAAQQSETWGWDEEYGSPELDAEPSGADESYSLPPSPMLRKVLLETQSWSLDELEFWAAEEGRRWTSSSRAPPSGSELLSIRALISEPHSAWASIFSGPPSGPAAVLVVHPRDDPVSLQGSTHGPPDVIFSDNGEGLIPPLKYQAGSAAASAAASALVEVGSTARRSMRRLAKSSPPSLLVVGGLELSDLGANLLVTFPEASVGNSSTTMITFLSTTSGHQEPVRVASARTAGSMAFNPTKTKLYLADVAEPPRLLAAEIADTEMCVNTSTRFEILHTFEGDGRYPYVRNLSFSRQSFSGDGSCLYLVDPALSQVWGFNPLSRAFTLIWGWMHKASGPGPDSEAAAEPEVLGPDSGLLDIVATDDGCNLFCIGTPPSPSLSEVSSSNSSGSSIYWVTLDSPCAASGSVKTVARADGFALHGVALHQFDGKLFLYVGSNDGRVFELEIEWSRLHRCASSSSSGKSHRLSRAAVITIAVLSSLAAVVAMATTVILFVAHRKKKASDVPGVAAAELPSRTAIEPVGRPDVGV